MSADTIASTLFNGILIGLLGWLLNDKLRNMDFRLARMESTFFKPKPDCEHE